MDFASTLRVLAKHKILFPTMFLLVLCATGWTMVTAAETKQAAGSYVVLSAPQPPPQANGAPAPVAVNNPFSTMEQSTVVDILTRSMATEQVALELAGEGLVGTYSVSGNADFIRGPLLDIAVSSPNADQALAGYELVVTKIGDLLRQRQLEAGANPAYLMSVQRVSDPVVISPGLVGRIRSGIALLAAGLILSVGITLAVESVSNRRARRRNATDDATDDDATDERGSTPLTGADDQPNEPDDHHLDADQSDEEDVGREVTKPTTAVTAAASSSGESDNGSRRSPARRR